MEFKTILKKMDIEPINRESFNILISSIQTLMKYSENGITEIMNWDAPLLSELKKLNYNELKFLETEAEKIHISIEECQFHVQKLIPRDKRKKLAAYYTIKQGAELMASIVSEFLKKEPKEKKVLVDPFMGSGITLTTTIKKIGLNYVKRIWGIEPYNLAALVAYSSLIDTTKGRRDLVTVIAGDAFKEIPKFYSVLLNTNQTLPKADIILTNPPFTRWEKIEKIYRDFLISTMKKISYEKYIIRKQTNLQVLSMFLSDFILKEKGLLITVLPASTFYTIHGRGYKTLLKEKYDVIALISNKEKVSFSEDSGFKELILVAVKNRYRKQTLFIELNNNVKELAEYILKGEKGKNEYTVHNLKKVPRFLDINWLALFGDNKLRDMIVEIIEKGLRKRTLGYWNEVLGKDSIIRGIEMYGPDFFFIPNKYWKIVKDEDSSIIIRNIDYNEELELRKSFLVKALRKPNIYKDKIEADVNTFMLSIPPIEIDKLPKGIKKYIKWGFETGRAKPAINVFKKYWYSHVYKQIMSKRPYGQVFIPDKVDILFKNRGVFANYTKEKVTASKNFYIIKEKDNIVNKLLIGWFNSTIFISLLVLLGRKITDTWTRFLENDYIELPILNFRILNKSDKKDAITSIDNIIDKPLPSIWEQLNKEYRYELDYAISKLIGIEEPEKTIEKLYDILSIIYDTENN